MNQDGVYEKVDRRGKAPLNSQLYFCQKAIDESRQDVTAVTDRVFIPRTAPDDDDL